MQAGVGHGFLDGIQVLALEVFDEGKFQHLAVAGLTDNGGCLGQLEFGGGAPAALPGDEFVLLAHLAHDERLDDAVFADALDQFLQVFGGKFMPGLERTGDDLGQGQTLDAFAQFLDRGGG